MTEPLPHIPPEAVGRLHDAVLAPLARRQVDGLFAHNPNAADLASSQLDALKRLADTLPMEVYKKARGQTGRSTVKGMTLRVWKLALAMCTQDVEVKAEDTLGERGLFALALEAAGLPTTVESWQGRAHKKRRATLTASGIEAPLIRLWARSFCVYYRYRKMGMRPLNPPGDAS